MTRTRNALGDLFPTETPALMGAALGLKDGDRVLDIGGGHSPLPEASVVVEYNLRAGHDRDGHSICIDERYIEGDAQDLPFGAKVFDFAYASHVFEHVRDPATACREMMRVARRGYIETPRKAIELVAGYPSHRWLVDVQEGVLTFERRWYIESPFRNGFLAHVHQYAGTAEQALVHYRNLTCVQLLWEGSFEYKVIERDGWEDEFNYDNPIHAGWSHFYFALNLLGNGDHWRNVRVHANTATELQPNEGVFYLLSAIVHCLAGEMEESMSLFQRAKALGCTDAALDHNIESIRSGRLVLLLPMGRGSVEKTQD